MNFTAEVKKTTSKKTASLDMVYQVVLESNDPTVLQLGFLSANTLIKVTVEPENE